MLKSCPMVMGPNTNPRWGVRFSKQFGEASKDAVPGEKPPKDRAGGRGLPSQEPENPEQDHPLQGRLV